MEAECELTNLEGRKPSVSIDINLVSDGDGQNDKRGETYMLSSNSSILERIERVVGTPKFGKEQHDNSNQFQQWKLCMQETAERRKAYLYLGLNVFYIKKGKRCTTFCSIASVIASVLASLSFVSPVDDDHDYKTIILECALSLVTVFHIAVLVIFYKCTHQRVNLFTSSNRKKGFSRSSEWKLMILEVTCVSIHKIPILNVSRICNVFVLGRLFQLMRSLRDISFATSSASVLISALCNIKMDALFVFKTHLFKSPVVTMAVTSGLGFMLLSLLTWFFELTYGDLNLAQSAWYTFVTATTVGYGDYTPSSIPGKLVGVVSALYGIVVTAILVSVVQHKLSMSSIQKQIILFLGEVKRVKVTKDLAAKVIARTFIYYSVSRVVSSPLFMKRRRTHGGFIKEHVVKTCWSDLLTSLDNLRKVRIESSTSWAGISVLDVLHADTSDILAQNTVLQYLMRPADEDLSAMLRVGKYGPIKNRTGDIPNGNPAASVSISRVCDERTESTRYDCFLK